MKKVVSLLLVVVAVVAFNSCKKSDSPEAIAEKYVKAIETQKFDEAKALVTEDSKATIEMMQSMVAMGGEEAKKAAADAKVEIKDMKCDTKGDASDCTCKVNNGKEDKEQKLHLVKKDGKWLVEQKKEGGAPTEAAPADSTATATEATPAEEAPKTEKK
jgi:hypothetical protein